MASFAPEGSGAQQFERGVVAMKCVCPGWQTENRINDEVDFARRCAVIGGETPRGTLQYGRELGELNRRVSELPRRAAPMDDPVEALTWQRGRVQRAQGEHLSRGRRVRRRQS